MRSLPKAAVFLAAMMAFSAVGADAFASTYLEVGTSAGTTNNAQAYFGQSEASATNLGFLSSISLYTPITSERRAIQLQLGVQNRFLSASTKANANNLAMGTSSAAARIQLSRFYVGGGYSPLTYVSKPGEGFSSLHIASGAHSYFFEGGLIWRVIPEFQIALTYSREYATPSGSSTSTSINEYGFRFRFPLNPSAESSSGGAKFDGFRYPFGLMQ